MLSKVCLLATCATVAASAEAGQEAFLGPRAPQPNITVSAMLQEEMLGDMRVVTQEGARIPVGGTVRIFGVGSSNLLWETWLDQVTFMFSKLGYSTPLVDAKGLIRNVVRPESTAACDDASELSSVETLRIAKPGWSSWGFAYDSNDDCNADGFRKILGHDVSCTNAWQCDPRFVGTEPIIRPTDVAKVAAGSDLVILSHWVNDFTSRFPGNVCLNGEVVSMEDVGLTVDSIRRLIRAIHAERPEVVIVIMARYPGAALRHSGRDVSVMNAGVKAAFVGEPNVFFADFRFPRDQDMFLMLRSGHPNCRGDRVMASSVIETLFEAKVLSRGLAMAAPETCLALTACSDLSGDLACCQRAAVCRVLGGRCVPYGTGEA